MILKLFPLFQLAMIQTNKVVAMLKEKHSHKDYEISEYSYYINTPWVSRIKYET